MYLMSEKCPFNRAKETYRIALGYVIRRDVMSIKRFLSKSELSEYMSCRFERNQNLSAAASIDVHDKLPINVIVG